LIVLEGIREDIATVRGEDPAARSSLETALTYPGLHAVWAHRAAYRLWQSNFRFLARVVAALARLLTNVDIHPAAFIGRRLFIDHASGVVIGETVSIGDDVTLYQGVTLGGTSLEPGKRHPTVGDRVVIGAGAKVLGAVTVEADARIGANAVVIRDVPAGAVVVGVPGQVISRSGPVEPWLAERFEAPDSDPVSASLTSIMARIDQLERQIDDVERGSLVGPRGDGTWRGEDFSI
jgi:serine O-acetyltransferase